MIYEPEKFDGFSGSFLDYFLHEIECVHAKVRRYASPDEYPFTTGLPQPILPPLTYPDGVLVQNSINVNYKVKSIYVERILPALCRHDDGHYGSSATKDVEVLQLLSRRIHYGKFVAEAKFREQRDEYVRLIQNKDREGLMRLLTNDDVEKRLLERLRVKAMTYGQELTGGVSDTPAHLRIPVNLVTDMYRDYVIPLTKEVEVEYLLIRLDSAAKKQ